MFECIPGKKKRRSITRYNAKGVKTVPFKIAFLTKKNVCFKRLSGKRY